jgi:cytochrome c-type protein NapB
MKKLIISALAASVVFIGCANNTTATATSAAPKTTTPKVSSKVVKVTGIRQSDVTNESEHIANLKFNDTPPTPGQVKPYKKSFVTAPPMIPHSTKGMTPIKVGKNMCISCHMPQSAAALGIKSIPASHFKANNKLAGRRYFCTTCHAPQATVNPVVQNKFESIKKDL